MPTPELTPLYIGSLGPIPWEKLTIGGNTQTLARHEPPGADGQIIQPTGRRPRILRGEMLFFRSLAADLYPRQFREAKLLAAGAEQIAFLHPEEGQVYGHFAEFEPSFNTSELNGCRVSFQFEEALTRATVVPRQTFKDAFAEAAVAAQAADVGMAAIGVARPAGAPPLAVQVATLSNATLGETELDADQLRADLNALRGVIATSVLSPLLQDPDNAEVYYALMAVSSQATKGVEGALATAQDIIPFTTDSLLSPAELCVLVYETDAYVERIIELNPPPAPWYPLRSLVKLPVVPTVRLLRGSLGIVPTPQL